MKCLWSGSETWAQSMGTNDLTIFVRVAVPKFWMQMDLSSALLFWGWDTSAWTPAAGHRRQSWARWTKSLTLSNAASYIHIPNPFFRYQILYLGRESTGPKGVQEGEPHTWMTPLRWSSLALEGRFVWSALELQQVWLEERWRFIFLTVDSESKGTR